MLIDFTKMQAQGNDFLILDQFSEEPELDYPRLTQAICDRKLGFGADGLVLLRRDNQATARMIIYNSDGSRAMMCGSALRCISYLILEKTGKEAFEVMTDSGIRSVSFEEGKPKVMMGAIKVIDLEMQVDQFSGSLVDVGNLHYVVWQDDLSDEPHLKWGAFLEHHPDFPKTVNVHFAHKISQNTIEIKIWENAVGATLACGTGATASVASGWLKYQLEDEVKVIMPGGEVHIIHDALHSSAFLWGRASLTGYGKYSWKT